MKINVTLDNIKRGMRGSVGCPVALAMRDAGLRPRVGLTLFYTDMCMEDQDSVPLPLEATDFIRRFDNHKSVKPFSFEVTL